MVRWLSGAHLNNRSDEDRIVLNEEFRRKVLLCCISGVLRRENTDKDDLSIWKGCRGTIG